MTDLGERSQYDLAVYWAVSDTPTKTGRVQRGSAVGITCRWVETRTKTSDPQGNNVDISVVVETDTDIAVNSIMREGDIVDLPDTPTNLYQVANRQKVTCVKGRSTSYVYFLARYNNTLPDAA